MHENLPLSLPFPATADTLLQALYQAMHTHGAGKIIAEDLFKKPMSYRSLWWRARVLADALPLPVGSKNQPEIQEAVRYVGLMLPTGNGAMLGFLALHMLGMVPVMLNFSAGFPALKAAVEMTKLQHVITSRLFIEKAGLQEVAAFLETLVTVVYLEDVQKNIPKVKALWRLLCPYKLPRAVRSHEKPAVILFTSGTEGLPKGVALSDKNLLCNIAQAASVLKFHPDDVMFNALPVFHSFGLLAGMLLPLMLGIRVFSYPSPLHYKQIPKLCREQRATILLGTDTFLRGYAQTAEDGDFESLTLIVAGAEKLRESTLETYQKRFGIEIMQGYGVTETSPILSCNTLDAHRRGTVGKLLPGMQAQLIPVEGIEQGGRLMVSGVNVMMGYIRHDAPLVVQSHNGWHDTGDVVTIDDDGYLRITGRVKRFAKIGGEMVSLAVVEDAASGLSPEKNHAAIAVKDERKGEQIILYSEDAALTRDQMATHIRTLALSELHTPRSVQFLDALPRLGNGKVDYTKLSATFAAGPE